MANFMELIIYGVSRSDGMDGVKIVLDGVTSARHYG